MSMARWARKALALTALCPLLAQALCNVSATGVAFGGYDPFSGSPTDAAGTITVGCLPLEAYSLSLSAGSGSFATRTLLDGANTLNYNLYTDASRSTVWGDGSGGTATVDDSIDLLGLSNDHTVYGRIPAGQNPYVGSYADTITVTVTF